MRLGARCRCRSCGVGTILPASDPGTSRRDDEEGVRCDVPPGSGQRHHDHRARARRPRRKSRLPRRRLPVQGPAHRVPSARRLLRRPRPAHRRDRGSDDRRRSRLDLDPAHDWSRCMTAPDRTWDPIRFHRGTRGFAAFVTIINGLAVLAFGTLVVPGSDLASPLIAWLTIIAIAAGVAHFVAVYGLIRGRRWSGALVAYLAAAGIGASVFAILMIARAGQAVVGASDASSVGFFVWMIGSWLVATRFA